ncbi:hypothetical protein GCM10023201_41240 [Actinomycetospora corticicola]|uniref:Uncharacterized protein n=1 Tax=Actinomycetospora corticicola TaxID=663602 RepID=A0A7Y9J6U6_9PSEU|nr:hypothetical protein [Actinomycetospora corticicola]NYD36789.1 hypothetical protein [Actinomycetospora corticicola]
MTAPAGDPRVLLEETVSCPACGEDLAVPGGGFASQDAYLEVGFAVAREHAAALDDERHRDLVAQLDEDPA